MSATGVSCPQSCVPTADWRGQPPTLGVLFVHGIGQQRRGETLPWAGEPLYVWLQHRLAKSEGDPAPSHSATSLTATHLVLQDPDDADAPPYTQLWFRGQDAPVSPNDTRWVLAESWWAADFTPPAFGDLVAWGLSIGPFMLQRVFKLPIDRLVQIDADKQKDTGTQGDAGTLGRHIIARLLIVPITLVAQILFPLLIIGLLVLGLVPPLSGLVQSAQLFLAGWLGDAYVIATSPIRTAGMAKQIQHDVQWLFQKGCPQVAVIAHSGGASVAYDALSDPRTPLPQDAHVLFVTYGSGKAKVDIMRELLPNRTFMFAISPALRVLMLALLVAGPLFGLANGPWTWLGWSSLGLAVVIFGGLIAQNIWFDSYLGKRIAKKRQEKQQKKPDAREAPAPFDDLLPANVYWVDFCALGDIVAEGRPVPSPGLPDGSQMVTNLDSLLNDHSTYWQNVEQFVPRIVGLLRDTEVGPWPPTPRVGWEGTPADGALFQDAEDRRTVRVHAYLYAGVLSVFLVPILWLGLGSVLHNIGAPLAEAGGRLLSVGNQNAAKSDPAWDSAVGMALVALAVLAWHQLLMFPAWRWWSRWETLAMYQGVLLGPAAPPAPDTARPSGDLVENLPRGVLYFAGCLVLLPVLTAGLLGIRLGDLAFRSAGLLSDFDGSLLAVAAVLEVVALIWAIALAVRLPRPTIPAAPSGPDAPGDPTSAPAGP